MNLDGGEKRYLCCISTDSIFYNVIYMPQVSFFHKFHAHPWMFYESKKELEKAICELRSVFQKSKLVGGPQSVKWIR